MKRPCSYHFLLLMVMIYIPFSGYPSSETRWTLNSPDNNICITVSNVKSSEQKFLLLYQVDIKRDGNIIPVLEPSPLGLIREDQKFQENLVFVSKSGIKTIDEKFRMIIGRQIECRNYANEIELTFKNKEESIIILVLRAYNDGVAFKYVFPGKSDNTYTVTRELTGFKIPENGRAWMESYDKPTKYTPAYEKYYENGIPVGTSASDTAGWAFPVLFNSNGNWILISDANLSSNYCGVRLEQNAPKGLYRIRFPEPKDGEGVGEVHPSSTLAWSMPWRMIIVGSSPATIIESEMIYNLNDKAIPGDFSWVKPGRASWSWLSDNKSPRNYNTLKKFIDLSAEMKWEFSLIDANWDLMSGGNIEQLTKYANEKGVGIFMWYNSGGTHNTVSERPRNIMCDTQKRKAEFKKLNQMGVKGVKVDFWQSDKQNLIALYLDVLKDAAENHIMVNFHGCTIPRGWSRTYPNLIDMEAVKGEECYLFDPTYPTNAPVQNSILPFTRNAIGPMDYTPVGFSDLKYPHLTSYAHELALTIVFNSGILHFADNPNAYSKMPEYVKEFLKTVPVVFDETHYISGEPGESIVLASRKGDDWYLAGINSQKERKEMIINLPFVEKGNYMINLITDGLANKSFTNKRTNFKSGNQINLTISGYGGFVARLNKELPKK